MLTELSLPFEAGEGAEDFVAALAPTLAEDYAHLAEMVQELVVGHDYAYGNEFAYGLDLVLDGLEARLAAHRDG